jgi:hypothetical protein
MRAIIPVLICCGGLWAQSGLVVGKPYSATQVTHLTRTLADGTHIDSTKTKRVWRDGQGRFRFQADGDEGQIVISDYIAGVVWNIDSKKKTARRIEMNPAAAAAARRIAGDVSPFEEARAASARRPGELAEDLGSATINGVPALGVRVTTTIPKGAIGNDREMKSVEERWYSNEIHSLVRTVTTDPRMGGVATYELTNVIRAAPDPALFQVPAGYTVTTVSNSQPQDEDDRR